MDFITLNLAWDNDQTYYYTAETLTLTEIIFSKERLDFFYFNDKRKVVNLTIAGEAFIYPGSIAELKKDIQVQSNPLQRTLNAIE